MKIKYTGHAKERLEKRKITEDEVTNTIRFPEKSDSHVFGDSFNVPYVKKLRQIFTADQDDGTYSRKRIIDLVD